MIASKRYSCAETAKLVRARLKAAFPEVKFSVRSHVYAGGASLRIAWTDGPPAHLVEPLVERFKGATFDGMTDCKSYRDELQCDEAGNFEEVHYGSDFVFCNRTESQHDALAAVAAAMIRERCACDGNRCGNEWIDNLARGMVHAADLRGPEPLERAFRRVVLRDSK